ncbi:hypothetical protein ACVW00_003435 [Marmoricola sp. URHA0025 HA25]
MISTVIALPYELARLPLALVDEKLSERLSETSIPRVALDRALGSADRLAGTVLGNPEIAGRGAERLARSRTLVTAAKLEGRAAGKRQQAREVVEAGFEEAARERDEAEGRVVAGLEEADSVEARGRQQARAGARKTAAGKKAAADRRAESRTRTVEQRKKNVESAAGARKKAAQLKAANELDEARQAEQKASEKHADAERLGDLAEATKAQRTQN